MPALLDTDPPKVLAALTAVAGAIAGIGKVLGFLAERRRQREASVLATEAEREAAARAAGPFGAPSDTAAALAEARMREERLRGDLLEVTWRLSDVQRQLLVTSQENAKLKQALRSSRLDCEGLTITIGHLRQRITALEYQLGDALVVPDEDASTWTEDVGERIPTPMRPPKPVKA